MLLIRTLSSAALAAGMFLALHAPAVIAEDATFPLKPVPYQSELDPQMLSVLQTFELIEGTPIVNLKPVDARQQFAAEDAEKAYARLTGKQPAPEPVEKIVDMNIPGPDNTQLPIRVYTPAGTGPFPVVLYFHGGGFVIATIDTYDASARALANLSHAIIVSVEYRKAPEHPFPAAVDDAVASYKWLLANASSIDGDYDRIAVAGESAGGNLATDVCLYARENGLKAPLYQLLVYPVVSASLNFPSVNKYANAVPLSRAALVYFYDYYLPNAEDKKSQFVDPLDTNLRGLPPATVISAQIDPLQSEGEAYAAKLNASGVKTRYRFYPGVTHEFFGMGATIDKAHSAEEAGASDLREAFAK